MNMIQEATQSIQTPWQLLVTVLTIFTISGFYFFKRSEKKQDEMSKKLEEESKYHRDRAEKKDEENKEDRKVYTNTINNMNDGIKTKLEEVLREVRK